MFVHFRKRFSIESVGRINEKIVEPWITSPPVESDVVESDVLARISDGLARNGDR